MSMPRSYTYTFNKEDLMTIADQYMMSLTQGQLYELWCKYIDIDDDLMETEWDDTETPSTNIFMILKRRYYKYLVSFTWRVKDITSFEDFLDRYNDIMDERVDRFDKELSGEDEDDDA